MSTGISPFSDAVQLQLRQEYNGFCHTLCLEEAHGHAAHWFDKSAAGDEQVTNAVDFQLIPAGFSRRAQLNGVWPVYSLPCNMS